MKVYAQHGYGKSDKLSRALDEGIIDGVVIGPINEKPANLLSCVSNIAEHDSNPDVLIDPQFYVSAIQNGTRDGNLPDYDSYYVPSLAVRDFTARRIQEIARKTIDFQLQFPVSRLLSPTIVIDGFGARSAQVALFLAEESIEYHRSLGEAPPLLISLVFGEAALASAGAVDDFLNSISLLDAHGFYVVVARSLLGYQQAFTPAHMTEWLMMIFSLASANEFEVVCGYTDFVGIPAAAVGASALACGWLNNLRIFDIKRFQPSSGGRRPRARYSSAPLLNSIYLSELDSCYEAGLLERVLSGTTYDRQFRTGGSPLQHDWPEDVSALHHWETLSGIVSGIDASDPTDALGRMESLITRSQRLYERLRTENVGFEAATGPGHLSNWLEAINDLRSRAQL